MEIIKYIDMDRKIWDEYIDSIESSTFNHSSYRIEFDMELSTLIQYNESFILKNQREILGAMSLYVEEIESGKFQLSLSNSYLFAPCINGIYTYKHQEKYLKVIMNHVDEIAHKYNCSKSMIRIDPLSNEDAQNKLFNYNFLLKYGYKETSLLSQIIDLKADKKELWSDIRKGHKYEINRGSKLYEFEIYTDKEITKEIFDIYKDIYFADAKKVTRSLEMSHHYLNWIKNQKAILGLSRIKDTYLSAVLVYIYKDKAYYLSAAQDHNKSEDNLSSHGLQWFVINYLKDMGVEYYELGWQYYENDLKEVSEKEKNISLYKRGFGGYTVPLFSGIKNYEAY